MHDLDAVDLGLMSIDASGRITRANRWLCERARMAAPLVGRSLTEVWGDQLDPRLHQAVRECLESGHSVRLSHAFHPMPLPIFSPGVTPARRLRQRVDVIAVAPSPGAAPHCLLQVRDVGEWLRREQLLKEQSRQLAQVQQQVQDQEARMERQSLRFAEMTRLAPVGLFETDTQGKITFCNDRGAQMLALDTGGGLGQLWLHKLPDEDIRRVMPKWQAASQSSVRFAEELCIERADRDASWLRVELAPVCDHEQVFSGFIGTVIDVTEFRETSRRNEYRAHHDPLTSLANRDRFLLRLSGAIAAAPTDQNGGPAVLFIDLDRFTRINELHGHEAGDSVLRTVANRLRRTVRRDDLVARLGGDEFAVLLEDALDRGAVDRVVHKLVKAVGMPIHLGASQVQLACSVGVAIFPAQGVSAQDLLRHADLDRLGKSRDEWAGDQTLAIV